MFDNATRKVDELGRIVLPQELRKDYNINSGDAIDICIDNGNIVLRKAEEHCVICNNTNGLTTTNGKPICDSCRKTIKGE
jgi:transcriptional pleiotropic regulator of transition state genes